MILTLNPGGTKRDFMTEDAPKFARGDFKPPTRHLYVIPPTTAKRYYMGEALQRFFGSQHKKLLNDSVAMPLVFFRSQNYSKLARRTNAERFSLHRIGEAVTEIQPKRILVVGLRTFELLIQLGGIENCVVSKKEGRPRFTLQCSLRGIPTFVIPHLTGCHLSREEKGLLARAFFSWWNAHEKWPEVPSPG
jgi:hypothetical protein